MCLRGVSPCLASRGRPAGAGADHDCRAHDQHRAASGEEQVPLASLAYGVGRPFEVDRLGQPVPDEEEPTKTAPLRNIRTIRRTAVVELVMDFPSRSQDCDYCRKRNSA